MQLPIGVEDTFAGVVDLVKMKAIYWSERDMGVDFEEMEIPASLLEECVAYQERLVEAAAESDESLIEKFSIKESFLKKRFARAFAFAY